MNLKMIQRRLRELAAKPGRPGAWEKAQRLRGEAARLNQAGRLPEAVLRP
ncbi:hypothetical protein GCM10023084_77990 [Streptomyces lacrimifluminis]|uniref:Uncharacterized protein n=1 Tax=Streptomyces lacrimifluminis TaxID=1500077 RepID=A0A917PA51_9ACTN|nr:hypothetical protein [Streptomyces lacrimifluminis]GGJ68056.1 hypothetical protein GCM10012282_76380 [Streptomyces lacrimifluminis]